MEDWGGRLRVLTTRDKVNQRKENEYQSQEKRWGLTERKGNRSCPHRVSTVKNFEQKRKHFTLFT